MVVPAGQTPDLNANQKNRDFTRWNNLNSGQWSFFFGRLGAAAQRAWERMAIGEFRMRENIQRDIQNFVADTLSALPRNMRRRGGQAFFDILDGRTMAQITAQFQGLPGGDVVIEQARRVKERLEQIREVIRNIKRESYAAYLRGMLRADLETLFQNTLGFAPTGLTKREMADELAIEQFPDDWGIADGSYMPHLFFGQWVVTVDTGGPAPDFLFRAKTEQEARARIFEYVRTNPQHAGSRFNMNQDVVAPADMIRIGNNRYWRMVQQIQQQTNQTVDGREATRGVVGRAASKQKWWGSLRQRFGYQGYSKDYKQVMTNYLTSFHRWRELSAMNNEVMPLIEEVRAEGRRQAADRLTDILDNLWGKPTKATLQFDNMLRNMFDPLQRQLNRIPGAERITQYLFPQPLALDRWSRFLTTAVTHATLRTARFAIVNRLQPLQGLYPIIGERLIIQAKRLQHTAQGRALLDAAGVTFDPGQYAGPATTYSRFTRALEWLTGERSNQEVAYLGMYLHAQRQGLTGAEAHRYAKLRGQLMTQFSPLITDTVPIMEGPVGRVVFQFKRFPIKQLELLSRMVVTGNVPALVRFFALQALMGGLSFYMRQSYQDWEKRYRLKKRLQDEYGQATSDALYYGLPGMIGADLSGSLVLGDEPFGANIYEKAGRFLAGPGPSIAIEAIRAANIEPRKPMSKTERAMMAVRKFPTFRPAAELYDLASENTEELMRIAKEFPSLQPFVDAWKSWKVNPDVLSPDGETKYQRTAKDIILGIGSFRSANEANIRMQMNAVLEIEKETGKLLNRLWVARQSGDADQQAEAQEEIDKFNERWPEYRITGGVRQNYFNYRRGDVNKTDLQRALGKRFRRDLPEGQ